STRQDRGWTAAPTGSRRPNRQSLPICRTGGFSDYPPSPPIKNGPKRPISRGEGGIDARHPWRAPLRGGLRPSKSAVPADLSNRRVLRLPSLSANKKWAKTAHFL